MLIMFDVLETFKLIIGILVNDADYVCSLPFLKMFYVDFRVVRHRVFVLNDFICEQILSDIKIQNFPREKV